MANYITRTINELVSPIRGNRIFFGDKAAYKEHYALIDMEDDDLVTKSMLDSIVPAPDDIIIDIIAGTTETPVTVPYPNMQNPLYRLLRSSDDSFDWNTVVKDDGVNLIVNGADDGTGKFADSYTFIIKQA